MPKMIKRCDPHDKKRCYEVIADGLCAGKQCRLFLKSADMIPKLKRFHELIARGVIPYTVWDFSEEAAEGREKKAERARKWLELYPRIIAELERLNAQ